MTTPYALVARLEAKPEKAQDVADLLTLYGVQDENYREDNLPQIAIYTGERATAVDSETAITRTARVTDRRASRRA